MEGKIRHNSTLRDVALKAGVSVGTASKAFNNKGTLSADTRRRVMEAAASLSFAPNALIRSLQRGHTFTIGILTWIMEVESSRNITMQFLKGVTDGIAEGHRDTLLYSPLPERNASNLAATLMDGRVDGLVVVEQSIGIAALEALAGSRFPTVVAYSRTVPDGIGSVDIDNTGGAAAAVDYLIGLGHRRIAFHAPYRSTNVDDRARGYRYAHQQAGIGLDPALEIRTNSGISRVHEDYERFFALDPLPTAIVAADDWTALGWLKALADRGISVPQEMSIVGFDDAAIAMLSPGLTTMRQPAVEVGRTASRFVNDLIQGAAVEKCRAILPVEMVVRGTTAAPMVR